MGGWGSTTISKIKIFGYSRLIRRGKGNFFLDAISLGRLVVPSPKIIINTQRTYEKLPCKIELLIPIYLSIFLSVLYLLVLWYNQRDLCYFYSLLDCLGSPTLGKTCHVSSAQFSTSPSENLSEIKNIFLMRLLALEIREIWDNAIFITLVPKVL